VKPFVCGYKRCEKDFSREDYLKEHMIIHFGIKKFKCTQNECEKKFVAFSELKSHIRQKHTNFRISLKFEFFLFEIFGIN
jgi:uncharacterized Zn-finger protein